MKNQMRWTGHLVRMRDDRLPKRIFMERFLRASVLSISQGKDLRITSRITCDACRLMQRVGKALLMSAMNGELASTRALRNMRQAESFVQNSNVRLVSRISQTFLCNLGHVWICNVCSRILLSKAGYVNHMKSHNSQNSASRRTACNFLVHNYSVHACTICPKVCKSAGGLERHFLVHRRTPAATNQKALFECSICCQFEGPPQSTRTT